MSLKEVLLRFIKYAINLLIINLRLPFSESYVYVHSRNVKYNLINKLNSKKINFTKIMESYKKILNFHNLCIKYKVDVPDIYFWTSFACLNLGKNEKWKSLRLELLEKQKQLSDKKNYDFDVIEPGHIVFTIGNTLTIDAWIKSRILGFQENKRLILPLPPQYKNKIVNKCMINYYKPFIEIIEDPEKAKYYYKNLKYSQAWHNIRIPSGNNHKPYHSHTSAVYVQSIWDKEGRKPLFQLTDEHKEKGEATLRKMGLPSGAWFATCHVREPHYKDREDFRDSDINSYFESFKEITKRGGWVIRIGDKSMKPLPDMPQVVDYAISEFKSDWMDVFLLGGARFILGTSSGPTTVGYAFGVPIAMTNNLPTAATYLSKRDLVLPRLMQRLEDGRMLSLVELMTSPYSLGANDGMYTHINKVKTIPNTSLEIKNLTLEMLDRLDGTMKYSQEEELLQQDFKRKTADKEVMIGFPGFPFQCRIGNHFLKSHQILI